MRMCVEVNLENSKRCGGEVTENVEYLKRFAFLALEECGCSTIPTSEASH